MRSSFLQGRGGSAGGPSNDSGISVDPGRTDRNMVQRAENRLRQEIINSCLQMNASGLNQGTSGNISVRNNDGFLITPVGRAL